MSNRIAPNGVDLDAYKIEIVQSLLKEFFKIIQAEEAEYGKPFADELVAAFLSSYIGTCVFNSLTHTSDTPTDETRRYKQTCGTYSTMKLMLQEAIASGFSGGFKAFNPESAPEYYVTVRPLAAPPTGTPH